MKKLIFFALLLSLCFTFIACGDEPTPPPLTHEAVIFTEGVSDYTIYYEKDNTAAEEFATKLGAFFTEKVGATLPVAEFNATAENGKCIFVGNGSVCATEAAKKMNGGGDFTMFTYGDDVSFSVTNDKLYPYFYDLISAHLTEKITGNSFTLKGEDNYMFHSSDNYTDSYIEYYKSQQGAGFSFDMESVAQFFEEREQTLSDGTVMKYRIYVPYNYNPKKTYPMIVLLHGAGERGDDNISQLLHVVPDMFNQKDSFYADAIIVAPQCPGDSSKGPGQGIQWVNTPWNKGADVVANYSIDEVPISIPMQGVVDIIAKTRAEYRVDSNRLYAMGLSMGGFGTWDLITRHPDMFAAAIPICGGGDPSKAELIKDIPIYTFHGSADTSVIPDNTRQMVEALEAVDGNITYEEYEGMKHSIWQKVAQDVDVMFWLFDQSK